MNDKVDVLAVMERQETSAWHHALEMHGGESTKLAEITEQGNEARAAVAELIDVYEELLNELREISDEAGQEPYNNPRANAALARIKGE